MNVVRVMLSCMCVACGRASEPSSVLWAEHHTR